MLYSCIRVATEGVKGVHKRHRLCRKALLNSWRFILQ